MGVLIQYRNPLLFLAALAVLCAIPLSEQLVFDQRIESFFAEDSPDLILLNRSRSEFGGDEFVLVAWTEDRLLDVAGDDYPPNLKTALADDWVPLAPEAEERIRKTAARLNQIPGINTEKTQHLPGMLEKTIRFKNMKRAMVLLFEGTLIGQDARTTGIIVELLPESEAEVPRGRTIDEIRRVAATLHAEVAVAGEPVQVYDMFQLVEQDSRSLFLVSLAILSIVLLVMFHGLRWLLAPVGLVLGAVLITRAVLQLLGAELSMVSSMLNSLVTVIGIATFMHVIVHYRDLRNSRGIEDVPIEPQEAARRTLSDMAAPVFWTCATTAVGFGSLLVSQITPVRSFSVMMCLATIVVLAGCFVLLPATLASGSRLRIPTAVPLEHWLDRVLHINCQILEKRPVATGLICLLLLGASAPGVLRLTLETDFSRNFKESSKIVKSLRFVESRLGGAGSWEVAFDTPETLDDEFLKGIHKLTLKLREQATDNQNLTVLSLTDMTSLPPRFFGPTRNLDRIRQRHPELVGSFYNEERNRMRIVLRSAEQQPADSKEKQILAVRATVEEYFAADARRRYAEAIATGADPADIHEIQKSPPSASGMFVLLAAVIQSLLSDQLNSFLVATGGIFLCMTIAFRSLRIGLISLLPNIFPVTLVMGSLGWLGTRVNIGTAMITSVSMGLTVDSTIHYITAFERARRTTSVSEALQIAHAGAGRAVVFAHLALIAGFLVLTASRFVPLVYFGGLLTLSLVGGIWGDLVLLPLLLRWTTSGQPETTATDPEAGTEQVSVDD